MAERPNVLLVCTDHWPGYLLGINGHPCIQTPTLDQLCRNGVRFSRAYSETPVCVPARRTLMTGTPPRVHGDRTFQGALPMPELPTLAQPFRNAGYQAYAVGKLHVYPQRNRIGFDDVILAEEGRAQFGVVDDYELFLGDRGCAGQQFNHGMGKWAKRSNYCRLYSESAAPRGRILPITKCGRRGGRSTPCAPI